MKILRSIKEMTRYESYNSPEENFILSCLFPWLMCLLVILLLFLLWTIIIPDPIILIYIIIVLLILLGPPYICHLFKRNSN